MKQIITIVLIVAGFIFGYNGVRGLQESSSSIEIGDLKLSTTDKESRTSAYLYLGISAVLIISGVYYNRRKR